MKSREILAKRCTTTDTENLKLDPTDCRIIHNNPSIANIFRNIVVINNSTT